MKVLNVHEREFAASTERVGALLDTLSAPNDSLWPKGIWTRMALDRPLSVGAAGGHGPIRYFVETYSPRKSIKFRFTGPKGFDGHHGFEILNARNDRCALRHTLEVNVHGRAALAWSFAFRPMHDALLEDCLARAQATLGEEPQVVRWSPWVRLLRWIFWRGRARPQMIKR